MKCEVCSSVDNVTDCDLAGRGVLHIPVCRTCVGNGKFREWLAFQFEAALAQNPRWQRQANGTWSKVKVG